MIIGNTTQAFETLILYNKIEIVDFKLLTKHYDNFKNDL